MTEPPATGPSPSRVPRTVAPKVGSVAAAALLSLGVLSLALTPARGDHDMWWHLKTGRLIVESGWQLPHQDPFTYGSEGVVWHNHEWLAQIIMFGVFRAGEAIAQRAGLPHAAEQAGVWMLVSAKALVLLAAFGVVARTIARDGVCPILACLVALMAALASRWSIHCRPPVITYLFLAIQIHVLLRDWPLRHPGAGVLAALFHFALWSNLHGGWLAGLVVLGCWVAGEAMAVIIRHRGVRAAWDDRRLRVHALFFAAALAGTLVNPSGWRLYELTWRVMSADDLIRLIPEMQPPPLPEHWPFAVMGSLAIAVLLLWFWHREIVTPAMALAVLFFGWQAMSHARHVPLFAIVAAVPAARFLQGVNVALTQGERSRRAAAVMLAALLALALFIPFGLTGKPIVTAGGLVWAPHAPRNAAWLRGFGYEPTAYPADTCDFLLLAETPGRLWTNLNIGGYMIWRLSPEPHRVYTDSRFDVHGDSRQRVEASINGVGPDGGVPDPAWAQVLRGLGVNTVTLEKPTPLVRALWRSPDWAPVHEWTAPGHPWPDGTMTFIRVTPGNSEAIARARRLAERMGALPLPPPGESERAD
ncbi:MAG: hypothetical protein HUU25_06405 [Candidatus Sumerlaeia bacterium]|nr:hypothetical protein [Candidatus Sumerlaeia bacterium]